jgi:hypothetical protein
VRNSSYFKLISAAIILCFFAGTAFGAAAPKKKKEALLCSFEVLPSDTSLGDFDWETGGYVKLEQFKKYATKGKFSCQATFSVPADFMSTTQAAKVTQWLSTMTLSINTITSLKVTDWTGYKKFNVDVYVPDNTEREFFIKIVDASGKEYITSRPVKNGRNKLELLMADVLASRIDMSNIISLSLYIDTKNDPKDVLLYIDQVRLAP